MMVSIDQSLARLRGIISEFDSVLVAYSGGVDSALVIAIAHEQLGGRAVGCIGVSPSFPQRERRAAIALMQKLGAAYRLVEPNEVADESYAANNSDRCYFCKDALFVALRNIAAIEGWHTIADGTHLDDVADHVHGMRAAAERGVRSPLLEARLTKQDVRDLAKAIGLPVWNKPAMACLASRVPHGTPITPALLRQIEAGEDVLVELGFDQFRVRHQGDTARIELPPQDIPRAIAERAAIVEGIRAAGYRYVTLDLAGFRAGQPMRQSGAQPSQLIALSIHARS